MKTTTRPPDARDPRDLLERAAWDCARAHEAHAAAAVALDIDKAPDATALALIDVGFVHARAAGNAAMWALEDKPKARVALRALAAHLRALEDLLADAMDAVEGRPPWDDTAEGDTP